MNVLYPILTPKQLLILAAGYDFTTNHVVGLTTGESDESNKLTLYQLAESYDQKMSTPLGVPFEKQIELYRGPGESASPHWIGCSLKDFYTSSARFVYEIKESFFLWEVIAWFHSSGTHETEFFAWIEDPFSTKPEDQTLTKIHLEWDGKQLTSPSRRHALTDLQNKLTFPWDHPIVQKIDITETLTREFYK